MPPIIYGIYREPALSPGKMEQDAAILEEVLEHLSARGIRVGRLAAEDLPLQAPEATGVLHLAQGPRALRLLAWWEEGGLLFINSPAAVLRCYRRHLFPLLASQGFSCPRSRFVSLEEAQAVWPRDFPGSGWLKRAEVHAEGPGDVVRVATVEEALRVVADFARRRLPGLIWQEHVPGAEIKFYAVGPGRFFQAFWSDSGRPVTGPMTDPLEDLAHRVALLANLSVFGGDVILTPEGYLTLIDLNDWPSFSPCREAAALEIAHYAEHCWHL